MENPNKAFAAAMKREKKYREQVEFDVEAAINLLNRNSRQMPYFVYATLYDQISVIGYTPTKCRADLKDEKKRKTYAEDFKEHFGHSWNNKDNNWQCREKLYNDNADCVNSPRCDCEACWDEEMEADDE